MIEDDVLFGRQVPLEGPPQLPNVVAQPAIKRVGQRQQCQRCWQWLRPQDQLPNGTWYCRQCLQMGRLTSQHKLYTISEPNRFSMLAKSPLTWSGQLSAQQRTAAQDVMTQMRAQHNHLLWAVTGAGKTEIVYPALAWALQRGWRVAWASPRVDVCLELAPRLRQAFQAITQTVLYGDQLEPYRYCQLTICTTHQLLRFKAAFDWVVVDEVDAFPLAMSPLLQEAIQHAQKASGSHLYLTATPDERLQRQVARHQLTVTYVPLRYHGHLLPQIQVQVTWQWRRRLQRRGLPAVVLRQIQHFLTERRPFLIFVPHVADLVLVERALKLAGISGGATVHASDPERQAKVQAMRDQHLTFLVTATILERGVTFPGIAVLILGGDDPIFSTAALVQIAGRVGRSGQDPTGSVICYCQTHTQTIRAARGMIARLNWQGKRQGEQP